MPANPERAATWLQAIQVNNAGASLRICGRHFHESCFKISRKRIHSGAVVKKELKLSAIPTLHLPNVSLGAEQEVEISVSGSEAEIQSVDVGTQTSSCCLALEKKYKDCLLKISDLQNELHNAHELLKTKKLTKKRKKEVIKSHLSELGHNELSIKHILDPSTYHRNHSQDDICNALILKTMSNKSYEYLRRNKIIPLPSVTTLSKWLVNVKCAPGFDNIFFELLKKNFQDASTSERQAVLSFDEVDIKKLYQYDKINRRVYGNHKKMQVVMIRGMFGKWKQTIYFEFDKRMTKDLILKIALKCEDAGLNIRGVSFDLGNPTFLRHFGVLKDMNFYFENPADSNRRIYLFPDVPHLLKRLR